MDTEFSSSQTRSSGALTPEPDTPTSRSRWLDRLALVVGLTMLLLGPLLGGLFIFLSLSGGRAVDVLSVTTIGVSMMALGGGIGGALAKVGYDGIKGRPSFPFKPRIGWFWSCLVGFALVLGIGQALISFDLWAHVTFPLFHVLGVTLPALSMLLLIGWGMKRNASAPTLRQVIGQLALGAFGATAFSFIFEMVIAVIALVFVGVAMAIMPGGREQLAELRTLLADPNQLQDLQTIAHWLLKPGILFLVTVLLVVIAPMIEEGTKCLGVPLLSRWTRQKPMPAQGWLWGIAVGLGFAITEGVFNSAANFPFWAGTALLRIGATVMHATASGLTGLGWARALTLHPPRSHCLGRVGPIIGSFLASTTLHGLWNGMTILIVVSSLWTTTQPDELGGMIVAGLGAAIGLSGLALLTVIAVGLVVYLTWRLRR